MRRDLVLNDAEKKIKFKRLEKRRQEAKENFQEMPALKPINFSIDNYQGHYSVIPLRVQKAEIQDLFDENMSLRLSGLGFLMNEVFSGRFQTLKNKILLNSELFMTSISQAAISKYLVSDTLGSLTFIDGIPDIPDIDKKILDNIVRIQDCASADRFKILEKEEPRAVLFENAVGR